MSGFRVVVIENRCKLSYQGGYLCVRRGDDMSKVHLAEIQSIILQTNQVYVSAYLLSELAKAKVPLVVTDEKVNPIGEYLPLYGAHNTSKRVLEQLDWTEPAKKRVWQRIVKDKIAHQARILDIRACDVEAELLSKVISEVRSGDTTNREAHAARIYFAGLFGAGFSREAEVPVNAALNYGYAVVLSAVNREIVSRGYLTQYGINHHNEYNQFNLSCDLMEPFRPIVDRVVYDNVDGEFGTSEKHLLADILNNSIRYRDGSYRVSSVISYYVKDCLDALCRKLSVDEIESFDVA